MPAARRVRKAENILLGEKPEPSLIEAKYVEALAEEMVRVAGVRGSTGYKVPVLKNKARCLLQELTRL